MPERTLACLLAAVAILAALARPCRALEAAYLDGSAVGGAPLAVAAAPGVSLGVVLTPPGEPPGAPLVLEVSLEMGLEQPGQAQAPAIRWQAAAYAGSPVRLTWEFAYPFEVQAGTWTMRVGVSGLELASAAFAVTPAAEDAPSPAASPAAPSGAAPGLSSGATPSRPHGPPPSATQDPPPSFPPGIKTPDAPPENGRPAKSSQAAWPGIADPGKKPPRAPSVIGGDPARRVYAVLAGSFSEEARALWVASFLKQKSDRACVRKREKEGRTLYAVVAGWKDTREEAEKLKRLIEGAAPGSLVVPFTAGELEAGLSCR